MPSTAQRPALVRAAVGFREQVRALYREVAKFGIVGLTALVVDIGLFNYLRFAGGEGHMYDRPISAKIVSVSVATLVAYFGNRYWTFRHRGRTHMSRELAMFFLLNGIAMGIAIGCLYISHYVLGFTSALADNPFIWARTLSPWPTTSVPMSSDSDSAPCSASGAIESGYSPRCQTMRPIRNSPSATPRP